MVNNIRTVSDTKRDFYSHHTRPINSVYRRVVEELMVEMHLLAVNADFHYDPIYAFGVVTSFNKFMQGYRPEPDKAAIFKALCQAVESNADKYQQDAARLESLAQRLSGKELIAWLSVEAPESAGDDLYIAIANISKNQSFKYSRLFAIGLFTVLDLADPDLVKDEKQRQQSFQPICTALNLPAEKLHKDLELYLGNLEKMVQVRAMVEDTIQADRKKREQRDRDAGVGIAKE